MLQLFIANKNYSSWSMRPWVLLRQAGIPFLEVRVRLGALDAESEFKTIIRGVSPAEKVPVLVDEGHAVWDSMAIFEHLAERFPEHALWPAGARARARARSVCAEMHSGFLALRSHCPMNIEARLPEAGALVWRDHAAVRDDVDRLVRMWTELLEQHGGPLLFGAFSIADACFAPVCMRLRTYALPVPRAVADYVERVCALPGVRHWVEDACAEGDFLAFAEPYRVKR